MNFQAVSVGQKLAKDNKDGSCVADTTFTGQPGGYKDGAELRPLSSPTRWQKTDEALAA